MEIHRPAEEIATREKAINNSVVMARKEKQRMSSCQDVKLSNRPLGRSHDLGNIHGLHDMCLLPVENDDFQHLETKDITTCPNFCLVHRSLFSCCAMLSSCLPETFHANLCRHFTPAPFTPANWEAQEFRICFTCKLY